MSLRQNEELVVGSTEEFSYQSECHCAKTSSSCQSYSCRLVTSQNVTAPKQFEYSILACSCLVTSQNVTAPKPLWYWDKVGNSLVTSQNVTAPKLLNTHFNSFRCLVTSQNVTAPKLG